MQRAVLTEQPIRAEPHRFRQRGLPAFGVRQPDVQVREAALERGDEVELFAIEAGQAEHDRAVDERALEKLSSGGVGVVDLRRRCTPASASPRAAASARTTSRRPERATDRTLHWKTDA